MDYFKIYDILDSTNKEAHRLLAQGAVTNGLTLFAKHQSNGKGQLNRNWIAEPGKHMAVSIIYLPERLSPYALPFLSMKISLGIINALKSITPTIQPLIKWPNDIYARDKKLCGMLIENSLSGERVQHSIIGIGMNINEDLFPPEIPNAISLRLLTGREYDPQIIALMVRKHILNILDAAPASWKAEYDQHIFGQGARFEFISKESTFPAEVIGVTIGGHLLLRKEDGETKSYASHEVKWVIQ
jgi:BirA family transcriptional regulator, biotin operon repressor / biotin---[acetyl-CoA-carboxylase] ligase